MPDKITFQKNLIALEDLLLGEGQATQTRGVTTTSVTKINSGNFPYDDTFSTKEKIDSLDTTHYVDGDNLPVYIATPHDSDDLLLSDVLWVKDVSATERHLYYYDQLILKWNGEDENLLLDDAAVADLITEITVDFTAADTTLEDALTALIEAEASARSAADSTITTAYGTAITSAISALSLGTASQLDVGTSAGDVVQLVDGDKLPAVDGSNLTNLGVATQAAGTIIQRVYDENTAITTYSTQIARSGEAPEVTAGDRLHQVSITPKAIGNKILARFTGITAQPSGVPCALMFVDDVFVKGTWQLTIQRDSRNLILEKEIVAESLDPIVVEIRVGCAAPYNETIRFNDSSFGDDGMGTTLVIEEMKV